MPLPIDQRLKFLVFVVESPSEADIEENRGERDIIRPFVELSGITCVTNTVISKQKFIECLTTKLPQTMGRKSDHIPILHISTHGNQNGIQLCNGDVLDWIELKEILRVVNRALRGCLILCMSSCEGYCAIRMAMHPEDLDFPYYVMAGCAGTPSWSETAIAFMTFYHQLQIGEHIGEAAKQMRAASGNQQFWVEHAENSRQFYLDYIQKQAVPDLGVMTPMPENVVVDSDVYSTLLHDLLPAGTDGNSG